MSRFLAVVALVACVAASLAATTQPSFTPQADDCYFVEVGVPVLEPNAHLCPPPTTIGLPRT